MADFESKIRKAGQKMRQVAVDPVQEYIKQQIDLPLQAQLAGQSGLSAQPQAPGLTPRRGDMAAPAPDEVLPNAPTMRPEEQQMRMQAMIAAAENMRKLQEREQLRRLEMDQEDQRRSMEAAQFDPSSYKHVPKPGSSPITPPSVGGVRPQVKPQMQEMTGAIELSEDPEEMQRQIQNARLGR